MRLLTVDIGNSRAKLDVWQDREHLAHISFDSLAPEMLAGLKEKYSLDAMVFSTVRLVEQSLFDEARRLMGGSAVEFPVFPMENYDVIESYRQHLGFDRLAAFIAAKRLFPDKGIMIVDAGTAMTVDVVDKDGKFAGGNISLGLSGRLKALHEFTDLLPLVEAQGPVADFGTDTEEAIRCGAVNGVIAEIERSFANASKDYHAEIILLTGGDASVLAPLLKRSNLPVEVDELLVARGIMEDFMAKFGQNPLP